jgi:hypothetical protein
VHHASKSALGLASIKELAICHALHLVAASPAIIAAPRSYLADTNAREFAAKHVLKTTVRRVPTEQTLEWIFWG